MLTPQRPHAPIPAADIDPSDAESSYLQDDDYFARRDPDADSESAEQWRAFVPYGLAVLGAALVAVAIELPAFGSIGYLAGLALVALAATCYVVRPPASATRSTKALAASVAAIVVLAAIALPLIGRAAPPLREQWSLAAPGLARSGESHTGGKLAVTETALLAVTVDGLVAIDRSTRQVRWQVSGVEMIGAVSADGYVLASAWVNAAPDGQGSEGAGNFNGSTNPRTGTARWIWISPEGETQWTQVGRSIEHAGVTTATELDVAEAIASAGGVLVVPREVGRDLWYVGLSPTGEELWQLSAHDPLPMDFPKVEPNASSGSTAVLPSIALIDTTQWAGGEVSAVDAATGVPIRTVDVGAINWSTGGTSIASSGTYIMWQGKNRGPGCTQHGVNLADGQQWSESTRCFLGIYDVQDGWVSDGVVDEARAINISTGVVRESRLNADALFSVADGSETLALVVSEGRLISAYDDSNDRVWEAQIPDAAGKVLDARAQGGYVSVLTESAPSGNPLANLTAAPARLILTYDESNGTLVGNYPIDVPAVGVFPLGDTRFIVFTDDRIAMYEAM